MLGAPEGKLKHILIVEMPIGLAGICVVMEATVVKEDVPLLIPISLHTDPTGLS